MKFQIEEHHRNTPDEELVADLMRVASELGKQTVTIDEQNERGRFHSSTLVRRFGNWFKALEKAGLQKTRNLNIPEEELFRNLEEVWTKLGRQPRYAELRSTVSKYSAGTYEKRFGTWRKALERFVTYTNDDAEIAQESAVSSQDEGTRSRVRPAPNRHVNWRLRFIAMRRDNFACKACGRSPAHVPGTVLHVDHVVAWANGGVTVLEKLQTLCDQCNIGKSNLP